MKQFILFLGLCLILVSCANTVQETSSLTPSEESSVFEEVSSETSSETVIFNDLSKIANTISKSLNMRDLVEADEMVLLGMTQITNDMYDGFSGKVSYSLEHMDTVFVFYCSNDEKVESLKKTLEKAEKNNLKDFDNIDSEIFLQNGYVLWVVAEELSSLEEIALPLLVETIE